MSMNALVLIFLICSAICKGLLDAIADEGNKDLTWDNKYDLTKPNFKPWWYLGLHQPRYREKFPFSSTALVFLTDAWHFSQFMMLRFIYLSITVGLSSSIIVVLLNSFIILPIIHGVFFQTVYEWYRKQLKNQSK